jgi:hypothetical protein
LGAILRNLKKGNHMSLTSIIQIIKVGAVQDKKWEGREYQVQEAECLLLDENGEVESVGVLRLSEKFRKDPPVKGTYTAVFSLVASPKDRRIGALVTGLAPVPPNALTRTPPAPAPAAALAPAKA